jgi:hypothetical protein
MRLIAIFAALLLPMCAAGPSFAESNSAPDDLWETLRACRENKDCASAAEVWTACNHVCGTVKNDRCSEGDRVCAAFNRTTPITAQCVVNAPCKAPKRIWCEKSICRSA